jgi:predicted dehydrogenase
VVIATPDDLHCEMALAAIAAGKHVLCEKPLANTAGEARRMQQAAARAGLKNMVLFTWRWQPHWRYVKRLMDEGYIGQCRHAELRFLNGAAIRRELPVASRWAAGQRYRWGSRVPHDRLCAMVPGRHSVC